MGLFKTAAKVAVASSVHGRVQRRQQARWSAQDQAAAAQPVAVHQTTAPVESVVAGQPPGVPAPFDANNMLVQLQQLGQLRDSGVLRDQEFETQKARILAQ